MFSYSQATVERAMAKKTRGILDDANSEIY